MAGAAERCADIAIVEHRLHLAVSGQPLGESIDHADAAARAPPRVDRFGTCPVGGMGAGIIDMFAMGQRRQHHRQADGGPGAEIDNVDVRVGAHLLRVPEGARQPQPVGGSARRFLARGADGGDLHAGDGAPGGEMGEGAPSGADDADAQGHYSIVPRMVPTS